MNYSRQREAILDVLRSTRSHPSANWVFENVKSIIPNISLATVYRNLKQLEESGEIMRINAGLSEERFDGFNYNHAHFVCRECGKIEDMDIDGNLKLRVLSACPEKADDFSIVYTGVCNDCKTKNKNN